MLKREVNLTGRPLQPILRGRPAVIREPTGCRRTTPVLWVEQLSSRGQPQRRVGAVQQGHP